VEEPCARRSDRLARHKFKLVNQAVDVWPVHVTVSDATTARFLPLLAPDELARAARFRFDNLRNSFIFARGVLRVLLGRYLNMPPANITFSYGPMGKPSITQPLDIRFNASHSGDLALFAFTIGCEVGIDLEEIRPLQDIHEIANRYFCSEEATELMSLPEEDRERAFFLCWTRKEAYIKAVGDGLSVPLDSFRVTLQVGEPARFVHIAHDKDAAKAWMLHNIELLSHYAAALAYMEAPRPVNVLSLAEPAELVELL